MGCNVGTVMGTLKVRFFGLILLLAVGSAHAQDAAPVADLELVNDTVVQFADGDLAKRLLAVEDDFLTRMRPLERQIRLGAEEPVSKDAYLQHLKDGVRSWSAQEQKTLVSAVESLRPKFARYKLPFPKVIYFVRVSKEIESDAPHCRGPAIVFPDGFFESEGDVEKTLAHELFHVLSSHNRGLRDKLYQVIGFTRCEEIHLPASLTSRRLTNPDAPTYEHFITLQQGDEQVLATPITFTKSASYQGGGLFQNLEFQLMVLQRDGDRIVPKLNDNKPVLLSPRESADFIKQIGRNTGYIIHPEETLADNFWMLVLEHEVRDDWIPQKMKSILQE